VADISIGQPKFLVRTSVIRDDDGWHVRVRLSIPNEGGGDAGRLPRPFKTQADADRNGREIARSSGRKWGSPMPERGLFRWAGAKRHLVERVGPLIRAHREATGGRLISLFFGAARSSGLWAAARWRRMPRPNCSSLRGPPEGSPEAVHAALLALDADTSERARPTMRCGSSSASKA